MSSSTSTQTAADLAGVAALLEIAEELGLSPLLDRAEPFTLQELAEAGGIPEHGATSLVQALCAAGLLEPTGDPAKFLPSPDLPDQRYQAGYLSWALTANRPFIDHAPEFFRDPSGAAQKYQRDGRRVAVSSRWVGSQGFYPAAFSTILEHRPARIADLGAGAGALVINVLRSLPDSSGVVLDMSPAACQEATQAATRAGLTDRLRVVNAKIESLIADPSPVADAELVHAGFVIHDISADPDTLHAVLHACRTAMAPGGRLLITDAIPYAPDPPERKFSALFTYLHTAFMAVQLPTQTQWQHAFHTAGFTNITTTQHHMPGARMFLATA